MNAQVEMETADAILREKRINAKHPHPRALAAAKNLMAGRPYVTFRDDGGILLTWTGDGLDLSIWIEPTDDLSRQWRESATR